MNLSAEAIKEWLYSQAWFLDMSTFLSKGNDNIGIYILFGVVLISLLLLVGSLKSD